MLIDAKTEAILSRNVIHACTVVPILNHQYSYLKKKQKN